jgi:hypothetical protein
MGQPPPRPNWWGTYKLASPLQIGHEGYLVTLVLQELDDQTG